MIKLLRSFSPEKVSFGTNEAMDNELWAQYLDIRFTYFQTEDQYVMVIFSFRQDWNCYELSFKTLLKSKGKSLTDVDFLSSYFPDQDMPLDANRATHMFRKVTYVALTRAHELNMIGFNGATEWLDRVYARLSKMTYLHTMLAKLNMTVVRKGRDIFFVRA